jgi:hypothetical protein
VLGEELIDPEAAEIENLKKEAAKASL